MSFPRTREGNVLTQVCVSVYTCGGGPHPRSGGGTPTRSGWWGGTPSRSGGYTGQVRMVGGGYPSQVWVVGGYHSQVWMVWGTPSQVGVYPIQVRGVCQPGLDGGGGTPARSGWWVVPHPRLGGTLARSGWWGGGTWVPPS